MSAEEIRGFAALLTAPAAMACGGVRVGDGAAEALLRPGGAVCVGRVMDVLHDEGRFYDTSEYVRARGMIDLPGACPVFRVAFHRGLVAAPDGGLADVDSLLTEELLQARNPPPPPTCPAECSGSTACRWRVGGAALLSCPPPCMRVSSRAPPVASSSLPGSMPHAAEPLMSACTHGLT